MKKIYFTILTTILLLASCSKEVPPIEPVTNDTAARDALYDVMNEWYYWYKYLPTITPGNYKDPYELMNALRYKSLDRWSSVQTYSEFLNMDQGNFVGHGIMMGLDPTNNVRIVQIYNKSPLYSQGVRRGWILKKLNGIDLAPIFIAGDGAAYSQLIGPAQDGYQNKFFFQIPDSAPPKDTITILSRKSSFVLNTVILYDTLHLKSGITGHLVLDQFITPTTQELETAFAFFKQNNISDLIVDLRYNPGGDLNVMINMATYIAGTAKFNNPFLKLIHNDKKTAENKTFNFKTVSYPLNLTKLITICTRATGSASEDLINGLKPFLSVKSIGDTTNGKPVGMYGFKYGTSFMFWPISFSLMNSENQGEFYKGLAPEKYVTDDITHDWSDRNESCLKEAIYYLEHGSVSPKGIYVYQPSVQFSEKPERINRTYIVK